MPPNFPGGTRPVRELLVRGSLPRKGRRGKGATHGVALPPGAAGGFYLGLAVRRRRATATAPAPTPMLPRARNAEQEQVGTGGRQAARRRAGAHRGGAAGVVHCAHGRTGTPWSDNDVKVVVRRVTASRHPEYKV
jgi:hypothetical protein